jgi:hypothetical protein
MNTEEIFQQVMDENCKDPLHRFAELVRQDEREQAEYDKLTVKFGERAKEYLEGAKKSWDTSDMAHRPNGLTVEQAEREPVAYLCENAVGHKYFRWKKPTSHYKPIALYTAPPKREWVGLTDDEVHKIIDDCTSDEAELEELNDFAKAIFAVEAKLKERNT